MKTSKYDPAAYIETKEDVIAFLEVALEENDPEFLLFGALPMEAMDLMVNPVTQEVVGAHGDREEYLAL